MNCTQLKFLVREEEEQKTRMNRLRQNIDADNWKRTEHLGN